MDGALAGSAVRRRERVLRRSGADRLGRGEESVVRDLELILRGTRDGRPLDAQRCSGRELAGRGEHRRRERGTRWGRGYDLEILLCRVQRGAVLSEECAREPAQPAIRERDVVQRGPRRRADENGGGVATHCEQLVTRRASG